MNDEPTQERIRQDAVYPALYSEQDVQGGTVMACAKFGQMAYIIKITLSGSKPPVWRPKALMGFR